MTQLLVSVRDEDEAEIALAAGAALIDVKEPRRGSLGAADAGTIARIVARCASHVPVSAALGELEGHTSHPALPAQGLSFAKLGLANCAASTNWPVRWRSAIASWPRNVRPVAVAYADWHTACAPSPDDVLAHATPVGCAALLIDTFDKNRGNLLAHLCVESLTPLVAQAREKGLLVVLAGSLQAEAIELLLPLAPDYVAVRTAACGEDRTARIESRRVEQLFQLLAGVAGRSNHQKSDELLDNRPQDGNTRRFGPIRSWQQEECRAKFGGRGYSSGHVEF
ncbi:MAG: (5-formylfuran-3-yl)methyl phosphate synthase [Pirellulales bacterium]